MNVLYVTNSISMYGANNSLLDMVSQLKQKGVNIYVLIYDYGEIGKKLLQKDIMTFFIPYELNTHIKGSVGLGDKIYGLSKNFYYIAEAKRIVLENHIDLIHTNASNVDFGAMLALACGIPHIWHIRELLYEDYGLCYDFPYMVKLLQKKAGIVLNISDYVAQKRKAGKNSVTVYDGLDILKYSISKPGLFTGHCINLLYCGIISHSKGTMDIVKAVNYLVKTGHTNIHLDVVGDGGSYWKKVKQYIDERELNFYIQYHGYQVDVKPFRERADIAVMCSRSEALGRVTVESMLGEVLVIGANCGGTVELIKDGKTGYLYEARDIKQLADKILMVYKEPEQSRRIVRRAKKYAIQTFDNRKYADKILAVYKKCLEEV